MKKISQSFIIDMRNYLNGGSCGHIIQERWIKGNLIEDGSKAMNLGAYFEFIFTKAMTGTGSLPKNGKEPIPEYYAAYRKEIQAAITAKLTNQQAKPVRAALPSDMMAPYQLAHTNSERIQQYFKEIGIKILKAGRTLTKGKFQGTIDILAEATKRIEWANGEIWEIGYQFVIDLKYSGTLEDKWSPYGWAGLTVPGDNEQKRVHFTQAIQYNYITDLPFYFMVVSSTNEIDVKFFKIYITEHQTMKHLAEGIDLAEKLEFYDKIGWEPRPDIAKCGECPLKKGCADQATYPQIELVMA